MVNRELLERFDGSQWEVIHLEGGTVVLTEEGQKVIRSNRGLRGALLRYKNAVIDQYCGRNIQTRPQVRRHFRSGGNSDVYKVGKFPFVIKEAVNQSVWSALDRMDYLYRVCNRYLPPHIRVPDHYGALFWRNPQKRQYLLMRKVNEGLTVTDYRDMGGSLGYQVVEEFNKARLLLVNAINIAREDESWPTNLLPDWDEANTVVDFSTPTQEFPFTLWVIDQ